MQTPKDMRSLAVLPVLLGLLCASATASPRGRAGAKAAVKPGAKMRLVKNQAQQRSDYAGMLRNLRKGGWGDLGSRTHQLRQAKAAASDLGKTLPKGLEDKVIRAGNKEELRRGLADLRVRIMGNNPYLGMATGKIMRAAESLGLSADTLHAALKQNKIPIEVFERETGLRFETK